MDDRPSELTRPDTPAEQRAQEDHRNDSRVLRGGAGPETLLLLHGLGATADVWLPLIRQIRWDGGWLAPDLPGHGGSGKLARYSYGALAARLAELLEPGDSASRVTVIGHSLGGVLGLVLASGWFGLDVARVVTVGVKVSWNEGDVARMAADAARPVRYFDDETAARTLYLKIAGLHGLLPPDAPEAAPGLTQAPDGWRLSVEPAAFSIGAPDLPGLLAAAKCPVTMALGEHDPLVSADQVRALGVEPVVLAGSGHSAHVQDPAAMLRLL